MRCQAAAGGFDKPAALLELIPMIFGPIQQTAQWEPASYRDAKQQRSTDQASLRPPVFTRELWCVFCGCNERWGRHLVSRLLHFPLVHQTHQRKKKGLSVCGPSSDCFVCLTDAFPIVCGLEARCWATVPVLTIFGRLSRINGDLPTSKHKQVDWPGERSQEFLFLSMECGKCCRVWYEARIIPLSLLFSYFRDWLNSAADVTLTLLSDMGTCVDVW